MVARPPDTDAIMPGRIFTSRANQPVLVPESTVTIAPSGRRGDSSQNTRCGLIGLAAFIARASSTRHHSATSFSIDSRQPRSALRRRCGSSARRAAALSPTRFTSIG